MQLTNQLNQALTQTPDICTILQASDVRAPVFTAPNAAPPQVSIGMTHRMSGFRQCTLTPPLTNVAVGHSCYLWSSQCLSVAFVQLSICHPGHGACCVFAAHASCALVAVHVRRPVLKSEHLLQTNATAFTLNGVTSLVMVVSPNSSAANAVAANPGHPHIGLWLASNDTAPMIMAVVPSWFSDGSPIYFYVPGEPLGAQISEATSHVMPLHSSVLLTDDPTEGKFKPLLQTQRRRFVMTTTSPQSWHRMLT